MNLKELSYPMSFPSSAATVEVHGLTDTCLPIMAVSTSSRYPRNPFSFPFASFKFTFILPGLAVSKNLDLVKIIKLYSMFNDQSAFQTGRMGIFFLFLQFVYFPMLFWVPVIWVNDWDHLSKFVMLQEKFFKVQRRKI